jgi:hypothetical protein
MHEAVWEEAVWKYALDMEPQLPAHRFRKAETIAETNIQLHMECNSLNFLMLCNTKRLTNKTGSRGSTSDLKCFVHVRFKIQTILIEIYHGYIQSLRMSVGISP